MIRALELAGFAAAHGIWCVSDGGPLIPMGFEVTEDGQRSMKRYVALRLEDGVREALEWLGDSSPDGAARVVVYDGYLPLPSGKADCLFLKIANGPSQFEMAVPYRSNDSPAGFAVFRPKFLEVPEDHSKKIPMLAECFFHGVDSHAEGANVWNKHMDQSL